jgi:membrane-bound metal-dependent hydrolase YbcI (DUF457 family)
MDTITHGIAGALIAKAVFNGDDLFVSTPITKRRVITWTVMLGSIFPDSDVFREMISRNDMLMITWHRSLTHSLVCLPIWSLLLAALTLALCRWRKWNSPSYGALCGLWAVGILSHIFLDLVTTYGTMIWSPLQWSRPAWDILFIVDFTFVAILLVPQFIAWMYEDPKAIRRRGVVLWLFLSLGAFIVYKIAANVGAPTSITSIAVVIAILAILFLLPGIGGRGLPLSYAGWNRIGLVAATVYLLAATYAHSVALGRIQQFASSEHLEVQNIGALPLPPSPWHWDGLVLTQRGVYEVRMDLSNSSNSDAIEHTYYPDAAPNALTAKARELPDVQKLFWFARFPVTRFHKERNESVVEFFDARFPKLRPDRPSAFDYQVRFSADGAVLSQGWVK